MVIISVFIPTSAHFMRTIKITLIKYMYIINAYIYLLFIKTKTVNKYHGSRAMHFYYLVLD